MKNKLPINRSTKPIELLAPAGNIAAGYAALHYGADAVYLGLPSFSARASADNLSFEELADITGYAHSLEKRRKIYVAVNTLVCQDELPALIDLLATIADIGVDAVIVQDLGVTAVIRLHFPGLRLHASTQMAIHNRYGVETAADMGFARVTLARELTLAEIAGIAAETTVETEVFIHGALCYSYSGLCLFSSHLLGRSGNRGKCAYLCRERFQSAGAQTVSRANKRQNQPEELGGFLFSMKDLALPDYIGALRQAGVTALKIEGRMKSPLYVAAAVNYYRLLIDNQLSPARERELTADLRIIFSRPWTDLYLKTRKKHDVLDMETIGHRGYPVGKAEEIIRSSFGHRLRFQTSFPIELHDGLQIDIAGLSRPFGFAVKEIRIIKDRNSPDNKRVFVAPENSTVEIPLPRGHPQIPLGAVIYSSSSQQTKRSYNFYQPKTGQFRPRHAADFDIKIAADGFDVVASAEISSGTKANPERVVVNKHFTGNFQKARDISQVAAAIDKSFRKLGTTGLAPGKLNVDNQQNFFVPASFLNIARREISAALENELAASFRKHVSDIKASMLPDLSTPPDIKIPCKLGKQKAGSDENNPDHFKWSIKTDQPRCLAAFRPDDWRNVAEIIVECLGGNAADFFSQIERLSGMAPGVQIRFALPVIIRKWESASMAENVSALISKGWRKWQISNPGGLSLLNSLIPGGTQLDVSSDWPLYVTNRASVLQLDTLGIRNFTLSPEDGIDNMSMLLREFAARATVVVYQDTPLMISETCIFASQNCSYPNACNFQELLLASPHNDKLRVVNPGCRVIVLNIKPFCLAAHLDELADKGTISLRADFIYRRYSEQEALDIWRRLRSGAHFPSGHTANFNRGLS